MIETYTAHFLEEVCATVKHLNRNAIEEMVAVLADIRETGGRVFFLGVGGGAGHASHAVNDFRKIAGIECYAPSDNVSELTARINDDGWESCYVNWLLGSRISAQDAVFIFSVGGGSRERNISMNIVRSLELAQRVGARILGVVGRDGGYTAEVADTCVVIPVLASDMVTPLVEAFQAVVWHLIVSHPLLKKNEMKWEAEAMLT